jgi:hypothetical protein
MFSCPICWEKNCGCARLNPLPQPALPHPSREHFESLVTQLIGCVVDDGTLEITTDHKYKNEHVRWLWQCYNYKGGR